MPIVKIDEASQVEFGFGDIEIGRGLLDSQEIIGAVCFKPKEAGKIGIVTDYGPENKWEIEDTPVRLTFAKTSSIDALIRSLEETKRIMSEKAEIYTNTEDYTAEGHQSTE
jgi:hypothetical protein